MRLRYPCTLCAGRTPRFATRAALRDHEAEQHPLVDSQTPLPSDREKRTPDAVLLREIYTRTKITARGPTSDVLADALQIDKSSVWRHLRRLVRDGLVRPPVRGQGNLGYQLTPVGLQKVERR